jgi:D-sedoheptulose 7-phosphate isomerase
MIMNETHTPQTDSDLLVQEEYLQAQLAEAAEVIQQVRAKLPQVRAVAQMLIRALHDGHRLYLIGNGGSALDAQHFAAELVGHYRTNHRPLPAFALTADGGILTSLANDFAFSQVFARQLQAYGAPGDVLIVFSTSGNSKNALAALDAAQQIGMISLALAGNDGGLIRDRCDYDLFIPSKDTARIQEAHLIFIHLLSEYLDQAFPET